MHRLLLVALLTAPATLTAQSLLDRPPNLSGDWVVSSGVLQFNFVHRFVRSGAPQRKVTNFPTFVIGVGLPARTMAGFSYATNSTLVSGFPNEWEFFARHQLWSELTGSPLEVGVQVGYNLAVEGLDGEVSVAKRGGPLRLTAAGRVLADPTGAGETRFALGGGGTLRLTTNLALAGDVGGILNRDTAPGKAVAWSAGIHLAIPATPHTLSIQATNTNATTLQGISRGEARVRYGFEFTVPITLARYFGPRRAPPGGPPAARPDTARQPVPEPGAPVVRAGMRNMTYIPRRIEVTAGTTIVWRNDDPLAHTVTAVDRSLDSGLIQPGGTWRRTFDRPGTYEIFCQPHPFMLATVVVRPAS